MTNLSSPTIERAILRAIENAVEEMLTEEEARAIERVKTRIREAAAGICASVVSNTTFERHGLDLVVRLRDDREKTA